MELVSLELKYICEIVPEKSNNASVIEFLPQANYKNAATAKLHKHGKGPFCKFKIPANLNLAGVYVIKVEDLIKYVGESDNLSRRFNMGYGNISPRNCYVGGQSTNCKINSFILKENQKGRKIHLTFVETEDRFSVERELIIQYKPEWNSAAGKMTKNLPAFKRKKINSSVKGGKYDPLKGHLIYSANDTVSLKYDEIERIIKNILPASAHKYREWWANGGHIQADAWLNAGFRVDSVKLGHSVVFTRLKAGYSAKR